MNLGAKKVASPACEFHLLQHGSFFPLTFHEACLRLMPRDQASFVRHLPYVLGIARRTRRPGAEEKATAALLKAIITFRRRSISGSSKKVKTLRSWITTKVRYAMLTLAADYPVSKVRDAVVTFQEESGRLPTLRELQHFSRVGPRQILNVWCEVADELGISVNRDSIALKLRESLGSFLSGDPETESPGVLLVRRVLQSMLPNDACLLVLKEMCGYSEQEILGIIGNVREIWQRTGSVDAVEACLDLAVETAGVGLICPWDHKLFVIANRAQLALRQLRARRRFRAISRRLGDS